MDEQETKQALKALSATKSQWMLTDGAQFISDIMLRMNHRFNPDIPTARTDGYTVEYSPEYFMSLTSDKKGERVFLVGHEVFHPTLLHLERRGNRLPDLWNWSCDANNNRMLIEEFGLQMPEGGIYRPEYDSTWGAESIYDDNINNEESRAEAAQMVCDMVAPGSLTEGVEKTAEALQIHMDQVLVQAVMRAEINGYGTQVPPEVSDYVESLKKPIVAWPTVLRYHMKMMHRGAYTTQKFNKRYLPDFFLATLHSKKLGTIGIAQDTSGSVTQEEHQADLTEAYFITRLLKPKSVQYVQWGTKIVHSQEIKKSSDCRTIELHRGGGTTPAIVFDHFKGTPLSVLIIFTDGYFAPLDVTPDCPVIWVVYNNPNFNAPFGQTIHYTRRIEEAA